MVPEAPMHGWWSVSRRLIAALGVLSLLAVFTLGVAHEYGHDAGHASESCAICVTARAPQATSPAMATLLLVALAGLVLATRGPEVSRVTARSTRITRGPPLA